LKAPSINVLTLNVIIADKGFLCHLPLLLN